MLTGDTSERPFARTHCTLGALCARALRPQPRSAHPGGRSAPQQPASAPRTRPPPTPTPGPPARNLSPSHPAPHSRPPRATALSSVHYCGHRKVPRARAAGDRPFPQRTPLRHLQPERGRPSRLQSSARSRVPIGGRVPLIRSRRRRGPPCRVTRRNSPQPPQPPRPAASENAGAPQTSGGEQLRVPSPLSPCPCRLPPPLTAVLRLPRGSWRAPWPRDGVCGARVVALGGWA